MFDVACIGILVADVFASNVVKLPEKGKLDLIDSVSLFMGGCAANAAVDMSRLGLNVAVLGKVGNDGFGKFLQESLAMERVNVSGVRESKCLGTSSSIVTVDPDGERSFLHYAGANGELGSEDIHWDILRDSKIVFVGGALLMDKFDGKPCASLLKKAREEGLYTALDTAWDMRGRWMTVLESCLEHLDLFMPSYEEAVKLSNRTEPEKIADFFLTKGVKTVVIKLGKKGCFIKSNKGESHTIPTYTRFQAVDTTGAGDSFVAGFLTGLAKGWSLYDCGKLANAVGTHCVMARGASTGVRSFEDTLAFMAENTLEGVG